MKREVYFDAYCTDVRILGTSGHKQLVIYSLLKLIYSSFTHSLASLIPFCYLN